MDVPTLTDDVKAQIRQHATDTYPEECCGLVLQNGPEQHYRRCRNVAVNPTQDFDMFPLDFVEAEDEVGFEGIVAVVHSHPDAQPYPSERDTAFCNRSGKPWFIVSCMEGVAQEFIYGFMPNVRRPALIGRPFVHGALDCYQIIVDYYLERFQVQLTPYRREDNWWETQGDERVSLYEDNFEREGFTQEVPVTDLQPGDMIVMQVRADRPNHAAVYDGDGYVIHHLYGRLSERVLYNRAMQASTRYIRRHRSRQTV